MTIYKFLSGTKPCLRKREKTELTPGKNLNSQDLSVTRERV